MGDPVPGSVAGRDVCVSVACEEWFICWDGYGEDVELVVEDVSKLEEETSVDEVIPEWCSTWLSWFGVRW